MRKLWMIILLCIPAISFSQGIYNEKDGKVIVDMEHIGPVKYWSIHTAPEGYAGKGYIEWMGEDSFGEPGHGLIQFKIKISTPGIYQFAWRSKVGMGENPTEHNDSWLRIPDASDFYALKDNLVIRPHGICTNDCPRGSGKDGWFKVYLSDSLDWTWVTYTSDHEAHLIHARFDKKGVYTIEISGRSKNHQIDRFVLFHAGKWKLDDLSGIDLPESTRSRK